MQLLFDFLPVIAFFAAYKLTDIYVATGVLIVAVAVHALIQWLRTRTISTMQLVSAGLVLVFGGLTLAIKDAAFIMWKPTIVNWLFGAAFLASQHRLLGGQPIVQRLFTSSDAKLHLEQSEWTRLNMMWVAFFALMGIANLVVFKLYDEDTWVNFKLFGMLGLTFAFILVQGFWISARSRDAEASS
jgi:intracellular septation protein